MPEDTKRLSELERATSVAPDSLLFGSNIDETAESGFSSRAVPVELLAEEMLKNMQFADLETDSKTIIEAINEASQGGGSGGVSKNYVDSQDEAVKNDLVNGYTTQNYLDDYYLGKNGLEAHSVGFVVSTPIYLNGKRVVTWYVGNDSTICLCAYRADGSFIDYFTGNVNVRTINFDDFSETRDVEIAFIKASFIKNKLVDGYNKIEDSNGTILYEVSEGVSINGLINHEVRIENLEQMVLSLMK